MLRIVAFAAFGGLLVGYDLGLIGGALQGIKVELGLSEGQQVRGTFWSSMLVCRNVLSLPAALGQQ